MEARTPEGWLPDATRPAWRVHVAGKAPQCLLMEVLPYDPVPHYPLLCALWDAHGVPRESPRHLPPTGFLARDGEGAVLACCFLAVWWGRPVAELVHLTSRPGRGLAQARRVYTALEAVTFACLDVAKGAGLDVLLATQVDGVVRWARRHGLRVIKVAEILEPFSPAREARA